MGTAVPPIKQDPMDNRRGGGRGRRSFSEPRGGDEGGLIQTHRPRAVVKS